MRCSGIWGLVLLLTAGGGVAEERHIIEQWHLPFQYLSADESVYQQSALFTFFDDRTCQSEVELGNGQKETALYHCTVTDTQLLTKVPAIAYALCEAPDDQSLLRAIRIKRIENRLLMYQGDAGQFIKLVKPTPAVINHRRIKKPPALAVGNVAFMQTCETIDV